MFWRRDRGTGAEWCRSASARSAPEGSPPFLQARPDSAPARAPHQPRGSTDPTRRRFHGPGTNMLRRRVGRNGAESGQPAPSAAAEGVRTQNQQSPFPTGASPPNCRARRTPLGAGFVLWAPTCSGAESVEPAPRGDAVGVRAQRPRVLHRSYGRAPLSRAARRTPLGAASKCTAPTCSGAGSSKPGPSEVPRWECALSARGSFNVAMGQRSYGRASHPAPGAPHSAVPLDGPHSAPLPSARRQHVPAPRPAYRRPVEAAGRRWCAERPWCQDRCCPDRCCPGRCCPGRCCSGRCCSGRCCSGG